MAYLTIFNSQIDADSPLLSSSLGHRLRDNPEAMHAGEVGAPKFLFPPGRGTASGLLRPDGIGGVRVGPYGAGLPPTLIISSGTFTIPRGVYRIIVEAWGAGIRSLPFPTSYAPYGYGISGHWGRSHFAVTPGEVLAIVVGSTDTGASAEDTSVTGTFGTMIVRGGHVGFPNPLNQNAQVSVDNNPTRSGGHLRQLLGNDGPRAIGGGGPSGNTYVAPGAVLLRGIP